MNTFLKLAFLFYIGSSLGWVLELFFRRFISGNNPERKWINPGFMVGPYVPLYGTGLCILYLVSRLSESRQIANPVWNHIAMLVLMAAAMTAIEYIAGILLLKVMNARLWDYSRRWGNVNGLICPLFSAIWAVMGAAYYFFVDPFILRALDWLSRNLAFSFVIGAFFGVFAIDFVYSTHLMVKIRTFAREKNVVVRYEELKAYFKAGRENGRQHFFLALHTEIPLREKLQQYYDYRRARREELARILRDYGEEPFAWQIAGRIVEARETAPIETTLQLADIVASAMPPAERRKNKNPSRRTFQALRIAVNHELDALEEGLDTIFAHLAPGGRLCVITFHSLEDRLVKNKFRRWSTACTCPPEFPVCVCGGKAKAKLITRKPIEANTQELEENRRSRSAHLRVLEKI